MTDGTKPELRVTVFSDYICPFCYVGYVRLEQLRDEFDLKVNWCLLEIHPDNPAHGGRSVSELGYEPEQWDMMQNELAAMAHGEGIHLLPQTVTTNSRQALLLAEAAKMQGSAVFYALHRRLFEAYFSVGRNIGDPAVLLDLAAQAGVEDATVERAWKDPTYLTRLRHNLRAAQELEVTGTPTFFIGARKLTGALSVATLRQAAHEAVPLV